VPLIFASFKPFWSLFLSQGLGCFVGKGPWASAAVPDLGLSYGLSPEHLVLQELKQAWNLAASKIVSHLFWFPDFVILKEFGFLCLLATISSVRIAAFWVEYLARLLAKESSGHCQIVILELFQFSEPELINVLWPWNLLKLLLKKLV